MFGALIIGQLVLGVDLCRLLLELFLGSLLEELRLDLKLLFLFHDFRILEKHSLFSLIFLCRDLGLVNLFLFIDFTQLVIVFHVVLALNLLYLALNLHLDKSGFLILSFTIVGLKIFE